MVFFFAGNDTSPISVGNTIYELGKNPELTSRLREEVSKHYKSDGSLIIDDLQKMDLMHATLMETNRVHPLTAMISVKHTAEDHILGGDIHVKKGTLVIVDIFHKHFNDKYYEDPYTFKPERFLNGKGPTHPIGFLGFSHG